jgi:hypothetical protein
MILNPGSVPTSGGNWWGEGDEKIWFDDDRFPSLFGTGSEDYFNYAWSDPDLFHHAYFAQPLVSGPDNRGFNANIRWHILDPLPFEKRIDFFMELFHHTRTDDLTYARIAYFYGMPNIRDDNRPIMRDDVTRGLDLPRNWQPEALGAAKDAVFYQAEEVLVGSPENVEIAEDVMWSAEKLVKWTPSEEGRTLSFKIDVEKAGKYQVYATFAHTPHSGKVAVAVDDGAEMKPVANLHTPHHNMLRNARFETIELSEGEHALTFISKGKVDAGMGMDVGIDFVWLKPLE